MLYRSSDSRFDAAHHVERLRRSWWYLASVLLTVFLMSGTARAQVLYVDESATGPTHDGSSWCSAYLTVQDALLAAGVGETIRVANGTYEPDLGGGQTAGDRNATFQLLNDVTIEGGYAGCGAADPDERDIALHETILSGDLNEDDGSVGNAENSFHVVTADGTDATAVLDGFTIRGGNADGIGGDGVEDSYGGGILSLTGSPTVTNCTLVDNVAMAGAGALDSFNSGGPTLTSCQVSDSIIVDGSSGLAMTDSTLSGGTCVGVGSVLRGSGSILGSLSVNVSGRVDANLTGDTILIGGGGVTDVGGLLEASGGGTLLIDTDVTIQTTYSCDTTPCPGQIEADDGTVLLGEEVVILVAPIDVEAGGTLASEPSVAATSTAAIHANSLTIHESVPSGLPGVVILGGGMSLELEPAAGPSKATSLDGGIRLIGPVAASDTSSTPPILTVLAEADVVVAGDFVIEGSAIVNYDSSQPLELDGNFDNRSVKPEGFDWREGKIVLVNDTTSPVGRFVEVAGRDDGVQARIDAEYEFGSLEIASGVDVEIRDSFDNDEQGQSPCSEALYVDELILRAGATLNLNQVKLCYKSYVDEGGTVNSTGCGALVLNNFCSAASQCDDDDVCTIDTCDGGTCNHVSGGSQIVFEETILAYGYCEVDPDLLCLTHTDCPSGTCGKPVFVWNDPLFYEAVVGGFAIATDIATYPVSGSGNFEGTGFYHEGFPSQSEGFWYLARPDCLPRASWQTVPGAEPGRDVWMP